MTDSLLAALLLIVAVAPARANDAAPRYAAPSGTVGCVSPVSVLHYSDAVENGDGRIAQRLLNGPCRAIDGAPYELLDDHNGTVKILVFKKPGDWERRKSSIPSRRCCSSNKAISLRRLRALLSHGATSGVAEWRAAWRGARMWSG